MMLSLPPLVRVVATASLLVVYMATVRPADGDEPLPCGHFRLQGVKVVPIDRTKKDGITRDQKSKRLTHWVRFDIHPKFEVLKGTETLPFKLMNPSVGAKSELTLDKPVRFKDMDVPAGVNLLKYRKFDGSFFNVSMPDLFVFAIHSVRIHSDFEIPADTYTVSFKWKTKDGTVFSDSVKVLIDVPALHPTP